MTNITYPLMAVTLFISLTIKHKFFLFLCQLSPYVEHEVSEIIFHASICYDN